jgi:hypothetical protein
MVKILSWDKTLDIYRYRNRNQEEQNIKKWFKLTGVGEETKLKSWLTYKKTNY